MQHYHVHDMGRALAASSWSLQEANAARGYSKIRGVGPMRHTAHARLLAARYRTHVSLHGPVVVRPHVRAGHVVQGYTRSAR